MTVELTTPASPANAASQGIYNPPAFLSTLPPKFKSFEEFERAIEFDFRNSSTEKLHPITQRLSQVMHESIEKGIELLWEVDKNVISGLKTFIPSIEQRAPSISSKLKEGGRIFLVGSGSSGRVAVDIAAKCRTAFPEMKEQVHGVIAGGDSTMIRAKERFEDSEADGKAALKDFNIGQNDTVILISASGSAPFNVGCGEFCAEKQANVLYFYNSEKIPDKTEKLFKRENNPVIPLCIDIGAQAIGGSTRLQGASIAEACLGSLLASSLYRAQGKEDLAKQYPEELATKMQKGLELIKEQFKSIKKFVQKEVAVFSDPQSNFRQVKDIFHSGYITFTALADCVREVLFDATETSPTFSSNPIRRETEIHQKRAEFRTYLAGAGDNHKAWSALLGREVNPADLKDVDNYIIAIEEEKGVHTFSKRPINQGNFLIGVAKIGESGAIPDPLIRTLEEAKKQGGATGLILICKEKLSEQKRKELEAGYDCTLIVEDTPSDALGLSETLVLKQTLNLISNSSMVLMNKVHGNRMIDVRPSNNKLIDRCIRQTQEIWEEEQKSQPPERKELYHYLAHIKATKDSYEEKGEYTPSTIKFMLSMLHLEKTPDDFKEAMEFLAKREERMDFLGG